jgi:hypothetical protein
MRAMVELPAIAIFTVVAGSLIVLVFIAASQQQTSDAQKTIQIDTLQRLDALVKDAASSIETEKNITLSKDTVRFSCDETGIHLGYSEGIQRPFHNLIIASPRELEEGKIITYTKGLYSPFRVANILYLSSPAYLLEAEAAVPLDLPDNFHVQLLAGGPTPGRRHVITKTSKDSGTYAAYSRDDNFVVVDDMGGHGTVQYGLDFAAPTVTYPNQELLLAAVLAHDDATYNCIFDQYITQLKYVASIHEDRMIRLKTDAAQTDSDCQYNYEASYFDNILSLPQAESFDTTTAQALIDTQKAIEYMNEKLTTGDNCGWIY